MPQLRPLAPQHQHLGQPTHFTYIHPLPCSTMDVEHSFENMGVYDPLTLRLYSSTSTVSTSTILQTQKKSSHIHHWIAVPQTRGLQIIEIRLLSSKTYLKDQACWPPISTNNSSHLDLIFGFLFKMIPSKQVRLTVAMLLFDFFWCWHYAAKLTLESWVTNPLNAVLQGVVLRNTMTHPGRSLGRPGHPTSRCRSRAGHW